MLTSEMIKATGVSTLAYSLIENVSVAAYKNAVKLCPLGKFQTDSVAIAQYIAQLEKENATYKNSTT